ncbi:hypothetical protein CHBEV_121 [Choristoneura biennis entomopoxvirus]|uniref:Uncharacterized protein n=1 Tax=Choristoneura biennis entomopoxvirus TaxID=10288 RepID=A0A916KPI9_CBEPV|nr:hypothetical protein CHBEV_121 [Choristoneura biennis entomopoxvirus]CCU55689.1 hypothetical protein CHBEV_121 [Choristoneura biennis entomopoxvirus]
MSIKYKQGFKYDFYPITIVINKVGTRRYCIDEWKEVYFKTLNIPDRFTFDSCCKFKNKNEWRKKEENIYLKLMSTSKKFSKIKNINVIYADETNINKDSLYVVESVLTSLIRKTCFNYYCPCDLGCRVDNFIEWLYDDVHEILKKNNDYVEDKSLRACHRTYRLYKPRLGEHYFCRHDPPEWYYTLRNKETEFYDPFYYEGYHISVLIDETTQRWYCLDEFKIAFFKSDDPVKTFVVCELCENRYNKNVNFDEYLLDREKWYRSYLLGRISKYNKINPKIVYGNLSEIKDFDFVKEDNIIDAIRYYCYSWDNPCCEECPSFKILNWMINNIYPIIKNNRHMFWEYKRPFTDKKFIHDTEYDFLGLNKYFSKFNDKHYFCSIERLI